MIECIIKDCKNEAYQGIHRDSDLCAACYSSLSDGHIPSSLNSSDLIQEAQVLYGLRYQHLLTMKRLQERKKPADLMALAYPRIAETYY